MTDSKSTKNDRPHARVYKAYVSSGAAGLQPQAPRDLAPRIPYLRHVVRTFFPSDRQCSILDLGCGYGALLLAARHEGYRNLVGVDLSAEQVKTAHALGADDVIEEDITAFVDRQPSNSVDIVITFDLIEHLEKPALIKLTDNVYRILKPGGRWIIHVPNAESPFFGRIRYGDFTHELAFTRTSLSVLLKASKFCNVECFEDTPIPHGITSFIRLCLWKLLRLALRLYIMIETGESGRACIFSQNLLAIARRPNNDG